MLRVLHVHSGNMFGGVERVLLSIASVPPADSGTEHEFALSSAGRLATELEPLRPVHQIGAAQFRRPLKTGAAQRALAGLVARGKFDVVIAHSAWNQALFGATLRRSGIAAAFWAHDTLDGRHWVQRLASRSRPQLVLCSSRFIHGTVPSVYPNVPREVVHYPLVYHPPADPVASREQVRADLGIPDAEVVITQVGRLEPYKGQKQLLEALGRLRNVPGWVCLQVGGAQRAQEHQYLSQLQEQVAATGIADRVRFIGGRSDVPGLLAASDIFCQPNVEPEPFGLTFIEALHAGLPVVTSNFGGGAEAVGEQGFLVPPGDNVALAETLARLIADPTLRQDGMDQRREWARQLTDPLQQCLRLRAVLEDLI